MTPPAQNTLHLLGRLLREARGYRRHILLLLAIEFFAIPLTLLTPLPLKIVLDNVLGNQAVPAFLQRFTTSTQLLVASVVLLVLIACGSLLLRLASALLSTYTGEKLVLRFRSRLFAHVQELSLAYHDSRDINDTTYRIQYDAPSIQWTLVEGIIPLFTAALTAIGMVVITARIDLQLALVALLVAPVLALLTHKYSRPIRDRWHDAMKLESSAMSVVQETISSVRVVKAFGREGDEHARFVDHSSSSIKARLSAAMSQNLFALAVGLVIAIGTAAVLYLGAQKHLSAGNLLIVMSYLAQIYEPMKVIGQQLAGQQKSLVCAQRAFALLDEEPAVKERPHARRLLRASGDIRFDSVCFAYDPSDPVLGNVSFHIKAGSHVAITGRTGAGKTTLVSLLNRFYDPASGQIFLDDIDLRDYNLADLRRQFSIVLQDPVLFSTTIAENIAYAKPGASEKEIIEAATLADAHEFIANLSNGYQTQVGPRGARLSGGQRQRISLARAFLRNAPVLILDEPTSSVDQATERSIMASLQRLMEGRTTFLITHRITPLESCSMRIQVQDAQAVLIAEQLATDFSSILLQPG